MKITIVTPIVLLVVLPFCGYPQEVSAAESDTIEILHTNTDKVSLGMGMGFDYGGFGLNLDAYPQKNIGLFFGAGWALAGIGYNGGVKLRMSSTEGKVQGFVMGMYGYNAIVIVNGYVELNRFFYGPTFGIGLDVVVRAPKTAYFSFALFVPVRGREVKDYMHYLEDFYTVEFPIGLLPVGISVGLKLRLK